MPESFANAVEIVARRLKDGETKTQLLQLVGNYRRRRDALAAEQKETDVRNKFGVGAVGKKIEIHNLAPQPELTPRDALELAAWLVATAAPIIQADTAAVLGQFHKLLGDAAGDGTDLEAAAHAALEEG